MIPVAPPIVLTHGYPQQRYLRARLLGVLTVHIPSGDLDHIIIDYVIDVGDAGMTFLRRYCSPQEVIPRMFNCLEMSLLTYTDGGWSVPPASWELFQLWNNFRRRDCEEIYTLRGELIFQEDCGCAVMGCMASEPKNCRYNWAMLRRLRPSSRTGDFERRLWRRLVPASTSAWD